jgi:hypothetical protein
MSSFLSCFQVQVQLEFWYQSPEDFGDPGSGAAETTNIDCDRFHIPDHRSGSDSRRGQIPRSQRRAALLS